MRKIRRTTPFLATGLLLSALTAQAQLTWDPDANQTNDGGNGTWDTVTTNWDDDGTAPNVTFTNGSAAIFGSGTYQVDLTSAGVTVGDLTYGGGGVLTFKGSTASGSAADTITIASGGATWDTGGGEIEFFNDGNNNNTRLAMTSGDTLTVNGGGTFDTGQNPQNTVDGRWQVGGATLDVAEATVVRGDTQTIGQFGTVKLAGGSTFFHERNVDRTYTNNWELGAGTVTFDNRYQRNYTLTGDISGAGGFKAEFLGNRHLILEGSNTFTGGLEVSIGSRVTVDSGSIGSGDITLNGTSATNGGILRLLGGVNLGSRDVVLTGTGGYIVNAGANTLDGNITGSGNLQIGNAAFGGNVNVLTLNGTADHTGDTTIFKGSLALGADNATSSASVLNIGGSNGGTSDFRMNGFDAEIAGLAITAGSSNVRQLSSTAAGSDLTINVASGESYEYSGNVTGTDGNISLVKTGLGTQSFNRSGIGYSADIGSISANAGTLIWDVTGNTGAVSVASGATLQIGDGNATGGIGSGVGVSSIGDANITNNGTVNIQRDGAISYGGVISGSGDVAFSAGSGNVTLSSAQTYTGNTAIQQAVVVAQVANTFSADSALTLGSGGGTSAFDVNGFDQEIGGLAFTGFNTREVQNNGGATATLTINVATGESYAYNANFNGSNAINIVKTGDGTQTFGRNGGYNTALGDVTVSDGELIWDNNDGATITGTVSVADGATLSGSGVIGGAISIAGELNPGNSPGTMEFTEDLTLESTATLNLEFEGLLAGEFDVLLNDGDNTLTAGGTLDLIVGAYTATLGDSFVVFENWGGFAGSFSSITGTDLGGGLSFDTSTLLTNGTLTVVPETSSYALLAGLLALASIAVRRRRD
ncbi:MAG: beta strand repeat-containing protein [Opitutaceae bacterium]